MKIAFLYQGPHKCHKRWAEAVRAEFVSFKEELNKNLDVFLIEGGAPLYNAVKYKQAHPKTKLIYLNADETFLIWKKKCLTPRGFLYILNIFKGIKKADGIISVSNLVKLNIGIPEVVVYPFIDKKYDEPRYNPSNKNILTVGYYHEKQGIDILVKAFKILKKDARFNDVKLFLVGKSYPEKYRKEDVILTGFIPDLEEIYKQCCLYVHAGRFQAFPVAPIEAMHYGLPAIVTNKTGVYEVLDKRYVVNTNPKDLAFKIRDFFLLPEEEKIKLSKECYFKSLEFLEEEKIKEFVEVFNRLLQRK
jgi:glycosyltransferase involved in cell wall biosynthesis